jgi:hypothetical protein
MNGAERMPEPYDLSLTALLGITLPRQPVPGAPDHAVRLIEAALAALTNVA